MQIPPHLKTVTLCVQFHQNVMNEKVLESILIFDRYLKWKMWTFFEAQCSTELGTDCNRKPRKIGEKWLLLVWFLVDILIVMKHYTLFNFAIRSFYIYFDQILQSKNWHSEVVKIVYNLQQQMFVPSGQSVELLPNNNIIQIFNLIYR